MGSHAMNIREVFRWIYRDIKASYSFLIQFEGVESFDKFKERIESALRINDGAEVVIDYCSLALVFDREICRLYLDSIKSSYVCVKRAENLVEDDINAAWYFVSKSTYSLGVAEGICYRTNFFSDPRARSEISRDAALSRHNKNSGRVKEEILRLLKGCRRAEKFKDLPSAIRFIQKDINEFVGKNSINLIPENISKNIYNWCKIDLEYADKLREYIASVGRKPHRN